MSKFVDEPSRGKQFLIGGMGVLFVALVIGLSWRLAFFDGFIGEMFALIVGVFSTPILLEVSLITLGLIVVIVINSLRLKREGDEFVVLEEVGEPDRKALAERALELGDYKDVCTYLESLSSEESKTEYALVLRLRLAKAMGSLDSAKHAHEELRKLNPNHHLLENWNET